MVDDRDEKVRELERLRLRLTELEAAAAERDELRKKLAQAEEHARVFVKHLPISTALFDREMRYVLVSDAWLSELRVEDRDVIGRNHYDVFPEITDRWKEIHQRCLAGATETNEEDPFPRADGRVDWLRWMVMPWRTSEGEIGGLFMFMELVTERKRLQDEISAQAAALRELSTPIVPISDDVLVMPLVGTLTPERSQQVIEQLLGRIVEAQAQTAIIDVTGIPVVDTFAASSLIQIAQAARLLGADVVLTGIRPEVAQALVTQDVDIGSIVTRRDLQSGVAWAMRARR
ncbi:PAS domain-containing protein [Polyangium aurulentum]|uniref:PAS domain-containing protein n=1 Tax=Polyangium aurulentum TaxID=2567896 RepID=UPI0010ADD207|nr:PAS domain-containing protein [Polyangium aurulentum]UQA59800.1 PAS domain-containing protein [Polyangium aurulentum]